MMFNACQQRSGSRELAYLTTKASLPLLDQSKVQIVLRRSGSPPGFPYGDRCVFLANDWHASLVRNH